MKEKEIIDVHLASIEVGYFFQNRFEYRKHILKVCWQEKSADGISEITETIYNKSVAYFYSDLIHFFQQKTAPEDRKR